MNLLVHDKNFKKKKKQQLIFVDLIGHDQNIAHTIKAVKLMHSRLKIWVDRDKTLIIHDDIHY